AVCAHGLPLWPRVGGHAVPAVAAHAAHSARTRPLRGGHGRRAGAPAACPTLGRGRRGARARDGRVSEALLGTLLIVGMFVLFAIGVEISLALGVVGVAGLLYLKGWTTGLGVVGSIAWTNASSFSFIAVPLFVFMSGVLLHSGIGRGLYTAVARWVSFLPGGLRSRRSS